MSDLDTEMHEMLAWHAGLSETDPRKHEMTAFIYMTCARAAWRKADYFRRQEARRSRREPV
jgi:hypothetical protein